MVKPILQWLNHSALALLVAACAPAATVAPAAHSAMEKKLGEDPDDKQINLRFAEQAEASGDYLRAEQYYLRAEALGVPPTEIVPRILHVLVAGQRYDEALERCRLRLQVAPEDRATRFVEAALLSALDRPAEAERDLSSLVHGRPDDAEAYLALGKLYRDGYKDFARARPMFEKYLALAPNGQAAAALRYELAEPAPAPSELEAK